MAGQSGAATNKRNRDKARAAYMKAHSVVRTTYRDPITNQMRPIGTYPGMATGKIKS